MGSLQPWQAGMGAGERFTDVNGYLECCKDAASHMDRCLSSDKEVPKRWPNSHSGSKTLFKKEEGGVAAPVLQQARHIPFPPSLIERHRNSPIDYWRMGIFPEICRVWVVLEHRLYLWNYMEEGGTDIVELETPLQERIFGVGLAKPPPGLFGENTQYMLVLVTPSYVLLHQVVFSTDIPHDEIRLVPTDYFVTSDELCGVGVPHPLHQPKVLVASTDDGRIFLCGQDAIVHEFLYPKDAGMLGGWVPSAKCRKVSHLGFMDRIFRLPPMISRLIVGDEDAIVDLQVDKLRKRLYTLSSNSAITVYDIKGGPNSDSPIVASVDMRRRAPAGMVVGIAITPARSDSKNSDQPDFVAFLEHGEVVSYRVSRGKLIEQGSLLPDTNTLGSGAQSDAPMCVNMCHYTGDVVLLAHDGNYLDRAGRFAAGRPATDGFTNRNDAILHCVHATGHDCRRPRPTGREVHEFALTQHPLSNSGVLALAEVPMELIVPRKLRAMAAGEWSMPELASQPALAAMIADDGRDASRWILALSKAGLHCFVKARPIDQFRSALVANQGADPQQMMNRSPLDCFSKEEMYCMLLQLACDSAPLSGPPAAGAISTDIREQALRLFMTNTDMSQQGGQGQWSNAATAGGAGWQHSGWQEPTASLWGSLGQAADRVERVSDRHTALACYLTRVLRPIFEKKMKDIYLLEPYKKDILRSVQQRLHKLRLVLENMESLKRPQNAEPHRLIKGSDTNRPRTVTEAETTQMTKLYFVVRRSEEACERLQGDAQRFHSKIGADAARRDWTEWENLTFKELIVEEKGQMSFYKVHRHLFLNELHGMDEGEAYRLLQLPRPGTESRSTFWGNWTQRRLQAERHLKLARTRVDQGRLPEGEENLRLALSELVAVVQEDRAYKHDDLRSHCNQLIEFNFFSSYHGFAQLCIERIKMLSSQLAAQHEIDRCSELLCQLVAFLYIDPPRIEMKSTEASLEWPACGLMHSLDLLPAWFRDRHPNETSELHQLDQRHRALRCAEICRSQILTTIFEARPPDLYAQLHEEIYKWFIKNDWRGSQTGATALKPGLFDVVDYSNLHQRRLQPVFLENYLERVTSEAELSHDAQPGDFQNSIDTLCAFYEEMGKFGKAARKFWNVATTDKNSLALAERIAYMKKAMAIERRSTSRRAAGLTQATAQDGEIKQAEAISWPNFLAVAELQLDAVRAVTPDSTAHDSGISAMSTNTPQRSSGPGGGDSDQAIPDNKLVPLGIVIDKLRKAMVAARAGAAGVGAPSISISSVASLMLRCYASAVVPPQDRVLHAPYICQLWEELVNQSSSLDQALSTVGNLYRNYGLRADVFTLEDEGGARGLLYRLERKHFDASMGANARSSVDECIVNDCEVGEERLSKAYYYLITTEAEPAFKLHLLGAATSFLVRWLDRVRKAAVSAGTTAAARNGLQELRRRLVAQCAERLAEYRHLVHAAATGTADEAAERVRKNLDALEAGQRELVELLGY